MKVIYLASAGTSDPTTASVPFHLAVNGSVEVGQQTGVVLTGHSAEIIVGETAATLEGIGLPSMRELLAKARDHQVPVYV